MTNPAHWRAFSSPIWAQRSSDPELLDDLELSGPEHIRTLQELGTINALFGGHGAVTSALRRVLSHPALAGRVAAPVQIVDVGCGGGDTLRCVARWARQRGLNVQLLGIDANENAVHLARQWSQDFPEIRFQQGNAFDTRLTCDADILLCSLFLHHFDHASIMGWLQRQLESSKAVIVNDLQRHWLPHALFAGLCRLAGWSPITRHDGLLSIRRGFRRTELFTLSLQSGARFHRLTWRWAFRYQLVLIA